MQEENTLTLATFGRGCTSKHAALQSETGREGRREGASEGSVKSDDNRGDG
jgi:hypothetical protein